MALLQGVSRKSWLSAVVLGEPVGLAVRWYGVMLVIAIASAVVLAAYRVERYGMNPEHVYAFTPWLLGFGIAGARLFYVIQYRDGFFADSPKE